MAEGTAIEWTDHTFNPWEGCQKVGPGCDHCYAEARNARYNRGSAVNWGVGAERRRTSAANWRKPLKWARDAEAFKMRTGRRQRVFCASLADVFDNAVPAEWRRDLFELIDVTSELDWLLLTKRIGNVRPMLEAIGRPYLSDHVWIGATIVNQAEADRDIPKLLDIDAKVRFLSMEPLLGPVDLRMLHYDNLIAIDALTGSRGVPEPHYSEETDRGVQWVIVGGESGRGARPMHPDWARSLRDQCADTSVPFLFKQWGEWSPSKDCPQGCKAETVQYDAEHGVWRKPLGDDGGWIGTLSMCRRGKKATGCLLDGVEHNGYPETSHG